MKKMSKVILTSIVALTILAAPACRTNRKKVDPVVQPPVAESTAPDVSIPPPPRDPSEGRPILPMTSCALVSWCASRRAALPPR